jgi:hypothetical protein
VAEHIRLTGCHEWSLHLEHFIQTLKKKPGALAGSTALQQADKKIKKIYETYYTSREKEFIELLQFLRDESNISEIERSIKELRKINPSHVTTEKIKILCAKNKNNVPPSNHESKEAKEITEHARENLKMYDAMFKTEDVGKKEAIA